MTFRKLQRFLAAGMVSTMVAGTVAGAVPVDASKAASNVMAANVTNPAKTDTINGVSADDEGVFKVTMDDTGYITADENQNAANVNTPFSWDNASVYFVLTDRFNNGDKSNDHSYGRSATSSTVPDAYKDTFEKVAGSFAGSGEKNAGAYETRVGTFHGGDLKGLTNKLNDGYFDDLGTNAIWISAPYEQIHGAMTGNQFKHYAYHGYYALDYTNVDANMGTAADLKEFVTTAHEHGIRVIFDIVMNHAGYADPYTIAEYYGPDASVLNNKWRDIYYNTDENDYHWWVDYSSYQKNNGVGSFNPDGWTNIFWTNSWIRNVEKNDDGTDRFKGCGGSEGGSETTLCSGGLPDFKTESTAEVGLPDILTKKWTKEGVLSEKQALIDSMFKRTGLQKNVTGYLVGWLSEWVKDYGIDGFRCDTAKHVEKSEWKKLYTACNAALKQWRKDNPDEPGAQWNDEFWMTGEHYDWSSLSPDGYFTEGGFTSMINFGYQGNERKTGASLESMFSSYAKSINSNENFNVLSYISSHDKGIGARSANAGTALLLTPGGVQTFYGDESGRQPGKGNDYEPARSHMNWDSTNENILSNWQKVGRFRRDHIAVGAGQHEKISDSPYTFSRTYTGKATVGSETKTDYEDKVVISLPGKEGSYDVPVGNVFEDGTEVRDAYASAGQGEDVTYTVEGGKVSGVKCDSNGVILLELPTVSVEKATISASASETTYNADKLEVTLKAKNATETYYQIGEDGEKKAYQDGDKIEIGQDTAYEEKTVIKLTGKSTIEGDNNAEITKDVTFTRGKEPAIGVSSQFMIRMKASDYKTASGASDAPLIWVYDKNKSYSGAAWESRDAMKLEGDYYVWSSDEITGEVYAIITTPDEKWRTTPDMGDPELISGTQELDCTSKTFSPFEVHTGDACKVTVKYVDQTTGETIKEIYRVGEEGADYTTYELAAPKSGYKLAETPENAKGKFTKEEITVTYNYITGDTPVTDTPTPTTTPTDTPTESPTEAPTDTPTEVPTEAPTEVPTDTPTQVPTEIPTQVPTDTPTQAPTEIPTQVPTEAPTQTPTEVPTQAPTPTIPATEVPKALGIKEFSASKKTPQDLGATITFKGAGEGGSGSYEYKFTISKVTAAAAVPVSKQGYSKEDTLKWTPDKSGKYTIALAVRDKKTGDVQKASMSYTINPKTVGDKKRLSITKFTAAKASGKYKVKLTAAASGGTGTKQFKFVRVYTSKGKIKYKTLKGYSTAKSVTWKAPKKGTYKFRVYVKDKKGLKVQVTKSYKVKK